MDATLSPTEVIDADHPAVREYARRAIGDAETDREQAIRLYLAVRDDIRYDPYDIHLTVDGMKASTCLAEGHGWCVSKSILLAAAARSVGIPARLAFADVRNHLNTKRLSELMGTDVFAYHGTTELLLDGEWVRCTPAFNRELCERFGVAPLEWDGVGDSLFQPATDDGRAFMEYVNDRGSHDDLPLEEMVEVFTELYPKAIAAWTDGGIGGDFGAEGEAER
jgi:transglutaminase-like putative cysteine protease